MNHSPNDALDRLAKTIVSAGGLADEDVERISSAPFLQARLRARIERERNGRTAARESGWLAALFVASRALAALFIVTLAAALAFWLARSSASRRPPSIDAEAEKISRVVTGGTCALSSADECAISNEEVLATLFAANGGQTEK